MMKIRFALILAIILLNLVSSAQDSDPSKISAEKRELLIQETARSLKNFSPDSTVKVIAQMTTDRSGGKLIYYKVRNSGIIRLNNGDWIYIMTGSSHDNEEVGDFSLAVDNKKNIYLNEDHVCGGIIRFETDKIPELNKTAEFFKYFVSDYNAMGWRKM